MITSIYDGNATIGDVPLHSFSRFSTGNTEYNPETAKQILIKSGYENVANGWRKNGKKLTFSILVLENNKEQLRAGEKIKEHLEEIMIPVTIKKQNWTEYEKSILNGKFDLALASIQVKNEYVIQDLLKTGHGRNYAKYSNEEMDGLIETLRNTENDGYNSSYKKMISLFQEEVPYIGLFFKDNTILSNKSVKGQYESIADDPYRNIINFAK